MRENNTFDGTPAEGFSSVRYIRYLLHRLDRSGQRHTKRRKIAKLTKFPERRFPVSHLMTVLREQTREPEINQSYFGLSPSTDLLAHSQNYV